LLFCLCMFIRNSSYLSSIWIDFRGYGLPYLVATLSLPGVAGLVRRGIGEFANAFDWKKQWIRRVKWRPTWDDAQNKIWHRKPVSIRIEPNWTDTWIYEHEKRYNWSVSCWRGLKTDIIFIVTTNSRPIGFVKYFFCYLTALSLQGVAVLFPYGYEKLFSGIVSFDSTHAKVKI